MIPAVGLPGLLPKHRKVVSLHTNGNTVADRISLTVLKDISRSKLRAVGHDYVLAEPPRPPAVCGEGQRSLTLRAPNGPKMETNGTCDLAVLSLVENLDWKEEFTRDKEKHGASITCVDTLF